MAEKLSDNKRNILRRLAAGDRLFYRTSVKSVHSKTHDGWYFQAVGSTVPDQRVLDSTVQDLVERNLIRFDDGQTLFITPLGSTAIGRM